MLEELLPYYEQELSFLRELSGDFAKRYPKIARRLQMDGAQCEDPHVERMIEAFAFLSARVQRKLDDEFPEITEGFLQTLYPHYTRPFPSATILQFEPDPLKPELTGRHVIPRHHTVVSPSVQGVQCKFRTVYPVELWPITLDSARIELAQNSEYLRKLNPAAAAITLEFSTQGNLPFDQLGLDRLRFFLDGDAPLMHLLYELLLSGVSAIRVSDGSDDPSRVAKLSPQALQPVGFGPDDGILDYDARSFLGYRLLTDYFGFPDKFMFVDLTQLDHPALRHPGSKLRVQIFLDPFPDTERHSRLLKSFNAANLKLGCAPAVNLFQAAAEPIRVTHHQASYAVRPDSRKPLAYEVISIDSVVRVEKSGEREAAETVPPFYAIDHWSTGRTPPFFWYATREHSTREHDKGTDLDLMLADLDFRSARPEAEVLSLDLTCSNRDLPESLPFGGDQGDFNIPNQALVKRVRVLRKPTPSLRAPAKRGLQWRLVSHLSLNYLSLVSQGREALQEMLGLYNLSDSQALLRQIQGIVAIESAPATTRISGPTFSGFVRGTDIRLTLDENYYVGSGLYLFTSVLDRFFALYCAPNSFSRLRVHGKQQPGVIAQWPARAGESVVI